MPGFTLTAPAAAPVEEVWKLLFDPTRFPEWWAGIATARVEEAGAYTIWPDGQPDYPMPQQMRADRGAGRVAMSCKVNDIEFSWQLAEQRRRHRDHGAGGDRTGLGPPARPHPRAARRVPPETGRAGRGRRPWWTPCALTPCGDGSAGSPVEPAQGYRVTTTPSCTRP